MIGRDGVSSMRDDVQQLSRALTARATPGIADIATYLAKQVGDTSHREVLGPLLPASGASGVVWHAGERLASWGDPGVPEMLFSATKSFVSLVAGVAFDRGLLQLDDRVFDQLLLPALDSDRGRRITWRHLLQQTSNWDGVLWDKPASVDAQSRRSGSAPPNAAPGEGCAYNDVRVNLACLALTCLFERTLPDVLAEHVLRPLGATDTWSWHGYRNSFVERAGKRLAVVSGGAHWGGGLWMSADDMALVGRLYLQREPRLISAAWIAQTFAACAVQPDYGLLWWRNDNDRIMPGAPRTGRLARGNGGRHVLWVDPARELVVASHWTEGIAALLRDVSQVVDSR